MQQISNDRDGAENRVRQDQEDLGHGYLLWVCLSAVLSVAVLALQL